ncbi:hypothetical protein B0J13DRAFT_648373 [Dactylonectria estremocensis]|uniref:Uncharacterized protein n=1 Tax=Dactylonectria estremocensis TaxID=1079267 RepID=A0A9P9IIU8_9HYPO|nr:hypothetical protein B0J13DRAFT_648373 [Dactylonectria estremocensis]
MRSSIVYSLLASAPFVAAIQRRWDYPSAVPSLERRQEPGTPRYACHENCGLLITLGRTEGYCDNDEWNTRYGACMICANTEEIWIYYSNSVTALAESCGLSPTPSPSGWVASSTVAEVESSTSAVVVSTTAAPAETTAPGSDETTVPAGETTAPGSDETTVPAGEETTAPGSDSTATSAAEGPASTSGASVATTFSTAAQGSKSASESAAAATETDSAATHTSGGSLGTVGVTPTNAYATPSTIISNGAAKNFGFGAAFGVAAVAMAAVY